MGAKSTGHGHCMLVSVLLTSEPCGWAREGLWSLGFGSEMPSELDRVADYDSRE